MCNVKRAAYKRPRLMWKVQRTTYKRPRFLDLVCQDAKKRQRSLRQACRYAENNTRLLWQGCWDAIKLSRISSQVNLLGITSQGLMSEVRQAAHATMTDDSQKFFKNKITPFFAVWEVIQVRCVFSHCRYRATRRLSVSNRQLLSASNVYFRRCLEELWREYLRCPRVELSLQNHSCVGCLSYFAHWTLTCDTQ